MIDKELRIKLWNLLESVFWQSFEYEAFYEELDYHQRDLLNSIWENCFQGTIDDMNNTPWPAIKKRIKNFFFSEDWIKIMGFLEIFVNNTEWDQQVIEDFKQSSRSIVKDKIGDLIETGISANNNALFDKALKIFTWATEIDAKNTMIWQYLGQTQSQMKDPNGALQSFQRALELSPDDGFSYLCIGNIQLELKQYEASIISLDKALSRLPYHFSAWNFLGTALYFHGQILIAFPYIDKILAIDQDFAPHWLFLSRILKIAGFDEDAAFCHSKFQDTARDVKYKLFEDNDWKKIAIVPDSTIRQKISEKLDKLTFYSLSPQPHLTKILLSHIRFWYNLYQEILEIQICNPFFWFQDDELNAHYLSVCVKLKKYFGQFPIDLLEGENWKVVEDLVSNEIDPGEDGDHYIRPKMRKISGIIQQTFIKSGGESFPLPLEDSKEMLRIFQDLPRIRAKFLDHKLPSLQENPLPNETPIEPSEPQIIPIREEKEEVSNIPDKYISGVLTLLESHNLDFKESYPGQGHDIGKLLSAFANHDGGRIFFGIANAPHIIVGLINTQEIEERTSQVRLKCDPVPVVEYKVHHLSTGQDIVEVIVKKSAEPVQYDGRYYFRDVNSSQTRPLTNKEIKKRFRKIE